MTARRRPHVLRRRSALAPRPRGGHLAGEEGIALISVIGFSAVIGLLVVALTSFTIGQVRLADRDADWISALSAAEAGVDDYLSRLNDDSNYWLYDAANPPPVANPAFDGFVPLPGPANDATFTYRVDSAATLASGGVNLSVTGDVDGQQRVVEVLLRRQGFLDYLYFTNFETVDPEAYATAADRTWAATNCNRHAWATPARDSRCSNIVFYGDPTFSDDIDGPLHSNDTLRVFGTPAFNGTTTSSDPNAPRWIDVGGAGVPTFAEGQIDFQELLDLPPNNRSLIRQTDPALGNTGCLFTGPTRIEFLASGRMRVQSPFTRSSNCPTSPDPTRAIEQALPANGVIYVQGIPTDPTDPNFTAGCPTGSHPFAAHFPAGDVTPYGCRDADVFVFGTYVGAITVSAQNDVEIVGDLLRGAGDDNVMGLIADNNVWVTHPVRCTAFSGSRCTRGTNLDVPDLGRPFTDPVIEAAILAVQHSFRVRNHNLGAPLGRLTVTGAIAQQYRGAVGTFSSRTSSIVSGFEKAYGYDARLRYLSPPFYLDPVRSRWQIVSWAER